MVCIEVKIASFEFTKRAMMPVPEQEMVALREDLRRAAEQHQTSPVNKRTLRVQLEELQEQFQKELAERNEEHERELEAAKEAEENLREEMQRLKQLQERLEEQLEEQREEQQHAEPWIG